ncbi:hypothetical protein Syun_016820 [Stephania yunnanensis]|uniref:Rhodanese domain-containing protein n=1 Tax=Stephania yunnanensis TaxID=152371 RepID=A0AAP0J5W6_9MAGN
MEIRLDQFCISSLNLKQNPKQHAIFMHRGCCSCVGAVCISAKELVQSGTVQSLSAKEVVSAIRNENHRLLDVRPSWEREKAYVSGSLHVPLFIKDLDNSPITLLKKWVHFGYIGLWTGQQFTAINPEFLSEIASLAPDKDAKLLVACGEGLRSLMAISKLYNEGGYRNLGWLVGGFNTADDANLFCHDNQHLQFGNVGGVPYFSYKCLCFLSTTPFC